VNLLQINNAGLISVLNLDEKPEFVEMMVKVNVLGVMQVSFQSSVDQQTLSTVPLR